MTTKKRLAVLIAHKDGPAALAELGYVQAKVAGKEAYDKGYAIGITDGINKTRQKYTEVANLAELAHLDAGSFIALIRQGCDVPKAMANIQALQSKRPKVQIDISDVNLLHIDSLTTEMEINQR